MATLNAIVDFIVKVAQIAVPIVMGIERNKRVFILDSFDL